MSENDRGRATIQEKLAVDVGDIEGLLNKMRERLFTELNSTEEKDMETLLSLINDGHYLFVAKTKTKFSKIRDLKSIHPLREL